MPYRLAIFDLDGTLSNSFPWFLSIVNVVADKHRFRRIAPDQVEALRDMGAREIIQFLGVPVWRIPAIARDMRRLKAAHLDEITLFSGVDTMLRELKARGVTLAIVSSDNEQNVRRALGPTNSALIAHYACGASLFGKAAKFRQVIKASGTPQRTRSASATRSAIVRPPARPGWRSARSPGATRQSRHCARRHRRWCFRRSMISSLHSGDGDIAHAICRCCRIRGKSPILSSLPVGRNSTSMSFRGSGGASLPRTSATPIGVAGNPEMVAR